MTIIMYLGTEFVRMKKLFEVYFGLILIPSSCSTFFPVLIIDSTYKNNKHKLPLLEIVGVTSTDMNFAVEFVSLEIEKKDSFTWGLEVCQTTLKDQENMS